MQAAIAVGLMNGDHAALGRLSRCFQHRCDFDGVMAVIIDDRDTAQNLAHLGKAAVHTPEFGQSFANFVLFHAQMAGHGNSR